MWILSFGSRALRKIYSVFFKSMLKLRWVTIQKKQSNSFIISQCTSNKEYQDFVASSANCFAKIAAFQADLLATNSSEQFTIAGYCAACATQRKFLLDYKYSSLAPDGSRIPNWRERLVCPTCSLNNRMRAAIGFLRSVAQGSDTIYLTEQLTPFFKVFSQIFPGTLVGSEFLRDGTNPGSKNRDDIRCEDVTKLTFKNSSINHIGTFDVLEHVPHYQLALQEFYRCLKPGGTLIISVPFRLDSVTTIVRAAITDSGEIQHIFPPEYHGDPLQPDGALCFYHFGWDFLQALRNVGFKDARLVFYWSKEVGYLGGIQYIIMARK